MSKLPRVAFAHQNFPRPCLDSIEKGVRKAFQSLEDTSSVQGKRIAVAVGSRGITGIAEIAQATVILLKELGADPFIVPAMGSHGGGRAEGQRDLLSHYGVTSQSMGVPVEADMETVRLGETPDGVSVFTSRKALEAGGVVLINRVKPHTDFKGEVESGLMKMMAVGLGKVEGASTFHSRSIDFAYDHLVQTISRVVLDQANVLFGLAVLENAYHETAQIELVPASRIPRREKELLEQAKKLMPSLPTDQIDVLVVDRIGKNISGVGMDPNITGRWYRLSSKWQETPNVTRIAVLDLTAESDGNAVGIGLADFCSARAVQKMDRSVTYLNSITSRNTAPAQIPMYFDTDREVLENAVASLGGAGDSSGVRLVRIQDTLNLSRIMLSEALVSELDQNEHLSELSSLEEIPFDSSGNILPIGLKEQAR